MLADDQVAQNVSRKVRYLIVGAKHYDGRPAEEGSKYIKAKELIASGCRIDLLSEDEFLALIENSVKESSRTPSPQKMPINTSRKLIGKRRS